MSRTFVTLGCNSGATFLFVPYFDVICDLQLNRRTIKWNLFVKQTPNRGHHKQMFASLCSTLPYAFTKYYRRHKNLVRTHTKLSFVCTIFVLTIFCRTDPRWHGIYLSIRRDLGCCYYSLCDKLNHTHILIGYYLWSIGGQTSSLTVFALVKYKTNRLHVTLVCTVKDHRDAKTSVALVCQFFSILPHFDDVKMR